MSMVKLFALADPFFLARRALRREIMTMAAMTSGIVLDVGCGAAPYRELFSGASYFGAEVLTASKYGSAKRPDFFFDGKDLPVADASVDAILCSQVLEHVFEPTDFLRELNRVLRPGGSLLLTVPFVWDEHEQPFDFARYSSFGLRHLATTNGFDVTYASRTLPNASVFAQLWLAYWYKVLRPWPSVLAKGLGAVIAVPTNLIGLILPAILPRSPDFYLDNVMIWIKKPATQGLP